MQVKKKNTILFLGDSVTDCGRDPSGEWFLGEGYPNMVSSIIRVQYPEHEILCINKGTSGNQTRHILTRLQEDVLDNHPDIVTLCIGINDVWRFYDRPLTKKCDPGVPIDEYRSNLESIIKQITENGARMILLTPYMVDTNPLEPMRTTMLQYAEVCKELAQKYNLEVLELQTLFEGLMAKGVTSYELSNDRIHPSHKGHMAIALELIKKLQMI